MGPLVDPISKKRKGGEVAYHSFNEFFWLSLKGCIAPGNMTGRQMGEDEMIRYQVRKKKRKICQNSKNVPVNNPRFQPSTWRSALRLRGSQTKGGDQPSLREVNVMEQQMDERLETWSKKTQIILKNAINLIERT